MNKDFSRARAKARKKSGHAVEVVIDRSTHKKNVEGKSKFRLKDGGKISVLHPHERYICKL